MSTATLTSKGQITLPKDIRDRLHLHTGEKIDFRIDETTGTVTIVPLTRCVDDVFGVLRNSPRKSPVSDREIDEALERGFGRTRV